MVIRDKKVGVISLGCDKNRVDTEKMLAQIKKRHQIVVNIEDAQILIVNTCAFLKSARQESVREILTCYQYKQNGKAEKIIVTGCLPQKFSKEVYAYIDSACSKGVIHKNAASRKVGRLATALYKAKATTKVEVNAEVKAETAAVEVAPVKATETKKTTKPAGDMLKVTLVKSGSGRLEKQTRTLEALGLRKTNSFNIVPDNAAIRGMIFVVKHLVKVEKV